MKENKTRAETHDYSQPKDFVTAPFVLFCTCLACTLAVLIALWGLLRLSNSMWASNRTHLNIKDHDIFIVLVHFTQLSREAAAVDDNELQLARIIIFFEFIIIISFRKKLQFTSAVMTPCYVNQRSLKFILDLPKSNKPPTNWIRARDIFSCMFLNFHLQNQKPM